MGLEESSPSEVVSTSVGRTRYAVPLRSAPMDILTRPSARTALAATLAALVLALVALAPAVADAATEGGPAEPVVLAAGAQERRPIAPTQRDQLGLVLYGFMAVVTVAGFATLRRQL